MRNRMNYFSARTVAFAVILFGAANLYAQDERTRERSSGTMLGESRSDLSISKARPDASRPDYQPPAREVVLSDIDRYLAASSEPLAVHLIAAPGGEISLREVRFGAAISQILALRSGYRTVMVSRGTYPIDGRFNVVFGSADALGSYLTEEDHTRIRNGYLTLRRFGAHRDGFLLIVTGTTPDKVAEAIMSLGVLKEQLPKASYASIREVVLPEAAPFMRKAPLVAGETYTFEQLKEAGALRTTRDSKLSLDLFLPGYIATDSDVPVSLTLKFQPQRRALGSSRPPEIHVNGVKVEPSQLVRSGDEGLEVQFPLNWLKAGRNVIETARQASGRSTSGEILGDSTLELPDVDKHPALPDLQLATRAFYPFIGEPSGKDLCIVLGSLEVETVESAWTFLAKLAQSSNTFFFESEFAVGELDSDRHNVIVADHERLPDAVKSLVNFEALKQHRVVHRETDTPYITGINLQRLIQSAVKGKESLESTPEAPKDEVPARWGFIASAPSGESQNLWHLLLTGASPADLRSRTRDLVQPEFWEKIGTDISAWGTEPSSVRVRVPGSGDNVYVSAKDVKFPTGDRLPIRIWYGSVAALMLFSTIVTCWLLGKCDTLIIGRQRRPR